MRARKQHIWLSTYHVDNFRKWGCEKIKFKTSFFAAPQIHTFLTEGDGYIQGKMFKNTNHFNPHLPRGRWPSENSFFVWILDISIHTFLTEGDIKSGSRHFDYFLFQSTPSLRKVTFCFLKNTTFITYFNPHLPHGRWRLPVCRLSTCLQISIHTFLAEGDYASYAALFFSYYFNPHLPHGRWHGQILRTINILHVFQSTPSSRKVTLLMNTYNQYQTYFNPHLPRGRWHQYLLVNSQFDSISIHTFLAEGDFS